MSRPHDGCNEYGQPTGYPVDTTPPWPRPERTTLTGRYTTLVPLEPTHAADLHDAFMQAPDGRAYTYLFDERAQSVGELRERFVRMRADEHTLHHAVIDRATSRPVGHAALMRIDAAMGVVEIGHITMSPRLQRTRMATEMLALFMGHVFDTLGYRRFEWKCDALNAPSRRAAERFGFRFEGIFRQAVVYKGRNRDTAWYSIVDHEWPALRAGYAAWLDPANFDQEGCQLRSLTTCRAEAG